MASPIPKPLVLFLGALLFLPSCAKPAPAPEGPASPAGSTSAPMASSSAPAAASTKPDAPDVAGYCAWSERATLAMIKKLDSAKTGVEADQKKLAAEISSNCVPEHTKLREDDVALWNACAKCQMGYGELEAAASACKVACTAKERDVIAKPSRAESADDYKKNVCDSIVGSGVTEVDPKARFEKVLRWSYDHVTTAPSRTVVGAVMKPGVDPAFRPALLRLGAREAGVTGPCALADAFEKAYPCPPGNPTHCGKDSM